MEGDSATVYNKPLSFQLKGIDPAHPYLSGRGISRELAEMFGVGYFSGKGSMSGRVVIPIHNEGGELVAYAGRAIDDSEPRYKLPGGFHKSLELFNLHRAIGESNLDKRVVVVEGFFDCMKVTAAGFPCVGLMGSSLSNRQEEIISKHFRSAILLLDADDVGRTASHEIAPRLARNLYIRVADLPDGNQPDQMAGDLLKALLSI